MVGAMSLKSVIQSIVVALMLSVSGITAVESKAAPYFNGQHYKVSNAQQAARLVKKRTGGKVLKVERAKVNGNPGYKVKVLKNNGHVVSMKVDAITGRISGK